MQDYQIKKAKNLIKNLKKFRRWDEIGKKLTQKGGTVAEVFVEDTILVTYNAKIYKTGSQDHPDFMIVPEEQEISIKKFNEKVTKKYDKNTKKPKFTLNVLKMWEKSEYNKKKIRMVRIEIKTGKGNTYMLNDTLPPPIKELDEIYILCSKKERKLIVTTSSTMAEAYKGPEPPISFRAKKSVEKIDDLKKKTKCLWEGTGITSYPRLNYSMHKDYAHHEATPEKIAGIFDDGGF